jgi:hypothetical protein
MCRKIILGICCLVIQYPPGSTKFSESKIKHGSNIKN